LYISIFLVSYVGRFRFLTCWVDSYVSNAQSLETSMELYKFDLTKSNLVWSLPRIIDNFLNHHGNSYGYSLLQMFVARYLAYDGVIKDTKTASWMSDGFCRCTLIEGNYAYKIEEPLIIKCVTEHFHNHNIPVATHLMDLVMMADDPATAGRYMDRVIACCFYDLSTISLPLCITVLQKTELFTADIKITMLTSLDINSDYGSLSSNLKFTDNYILPKHYAGPDGMLLSNNILWIVGCKTTEREHRNVDTRKVESNFYTTDLAHLFSGRTGKEEEKKEIWEYLSKRGLRCIIRVHIVLPGTSSPSPSSNPTFSGGGLILQNKMQKFTPKGSSAITIFVDEYTLDVDVDYLHSCGLFQKVL